MQPAPAPAALSRPSIFLITADTLRADHLGAYGYRFDTSPNIDRFAGDGMLFERCFSHAPVTRVSFASVLTGFLPHETQKIKNVPLAPATESIAETLTAAGYTSLAVIGNSVLRSKGGWDQGFAIYDEQMDDREANRGWPERSATDLTDRAIELINAHSGQPLFMWIHYQDPHGPYMPPPGFAERYADPEEAPRQLRLNEGKSGRGGIPSNQKLGNRRDFRHYRASYDGEISYMDAQFGRLIEHLKSVGAYDDSLIIFTSDHGEAMGERGYFFSHTGQLYSNNTRVPMILRLGDTLKGRRGDFCQHIDIVPTILGFVGADVDSRLRGRDFRQLHIEETSIVAATRSLIDKDGDKRSIIDGGYKLIRNEKTRRLELYSLEDDLGEENDLAQRAGMREMVARLDRLLSSILAEDRLGIAAAVGEKLDEEDLKRLHSLGYVE
jgi:arylsulfatase